MLLSAVSVLVVAQSSSEIPEGLMNNPVYNVNMTLSTTGNVHTPRVVEEFHTDQSCVLMYVKSNQFDTDSCYQKVGAAYDIPNIAV